MFTKKVLRFVFLVCLILAPATPAAAQEDADMRALLKQLITELGYLRNELRQQRAERLETTISGLEYELRQLHAERQRIDEQEREQSAELAELEQQLRQPNLDPSERAAVEASKAAILTTAPQRTRAEKAAILERERTTTERLQRDRQLRQQLLANTTISVQR